MLQKLKTFNIMFTIAPKKVGVHFEYLEKKKIECSHSFLHHPLG